MAVLKPCHILCVLFPTEEWCTIEISNSSQASSRHNPALADQHRGILRQWTQPGGILRPLWLWQKVTLALASHFGALQGHGGLELVRLKFGVVVVRSENPFDDASFVRVLRTIEDESSCRVYADVRGSTAPIPWRWTAPITGCALQSAPPWKAINVSREASSSLWTATVPWSRSSVGRVVASPSEEVLGTQVVQPIALCQRQVHLGIHWTGNFYKRAFMIRRFWYGKGRFF